MIEDNEVIDAIVEDGMIGDGDNGVPKVEVNPATGEAIDTPKYDALTAVQAALSAKPVEFDNQINGLLADRLQSAVEKRREEIARSIFNGEVTQFDSEDTDAEEGNEEPTGESEPTEVSDEEPIAVEDEEEKTEEPVSEE